MRKGIPVGGNVATRVEAAVERGGTPLRFQPRTRLTPIGHAIQHALFRVDRDGRTRLEKLGEMIVKKALDGDDKFTQIALDRFVGKVVPQGDDGEDKKDLQHVLLATLLERLVDAKTGAPLLVGSATATDVVGEMVRRKTSSKE